MERSSGPIFGYELEGKLTREELKKHTQEMAEAISRYGTIRVLVQLDGRPHMTVGALWEDIQFAFNHIGDFDRMAVIGDTRWAVISEKLASLVPGVTARHFDTDQLDAAWCWLEEPIPGVTTRDPHDTVPEGRPTAP